MFLKIIQWNEREVLAIFKFLTNIPIEALSEKIPEEKRQLKFSIF